MIFFAYHTPKYNGTMSFLLAKSHWLMADGAWRVILKSSLSHHTSPFLHASPFLHHTIHLLLIENTLPGQRIHGC
jgi:hypothetical protein